jgi:hypothetical protein
MFLELATFAPPEATNILVVGLGAPSVNSGA